MLFSTAKSSNLAVPALVIGLLAGPALAGSIQGTINYDGAVPPARKVKMDADPGCAKKHATAMVSETIVIGDGGDTLVNVFVYVKSGLSGNHPAPSTPAVLDQDGCRYIPHVLGVVAGQPVQIKNSDGLLHNIHALPKVNKEFNKAMPGSVTETVVQFDKAEAAFKIKCDVHPWMGAWIHVLDHPFFAVSGKDGKFEIKGLPAGTYELEAWHEFSKFPAQTQKVTVGDGAKTADFTFKGPPKKR